MSRYSSGEEVDVNGCTIEQIEADEDLDGVLNEDDACPGSSLDEEVDETGCTEGQKDDDGDGVPNFVDRCPDTPSDTNPEDIDENGCTTQQLFRDDDEGILADTFLDQRLKEIKLY